VNLNGDAFWKKPSLSHLDLKLERNCIRAPIILHSNHGIGSISYQASCFYFGSIRQSIVHQYTFGILQSSNNSSLNSIMLSCFFFFKKKARISKPRSPWLKISIFSSYIKLNHLFSIFQSFYTVFIDCIAFDTLGLPEELLDTNEVSV